MLTLSCIQEGRLLGLNSVGHAKPSPISLNKGQVSFGPLVWKVSSAAGSPRRLCRPPSRLASALSSLLLATDADAVSVKALPPLGVPGTVEVAPVLRRRLASINFNVSAYRSA